MKRSIDSRLDFLSPVNLVPGLGPKRVDALLASEIATIGDLLYLFPRRYIDRSKVTTIADCKDRVGQFVTIITTVTKTRIERGRKQRLRIQLTDDTGIMEALWFAGIPYFKTVLRTGMRLLCTGTVSQGISAQFVHPLIESMAEGKAVPDILFMPVYPITQAMKDAGVHQKFLCKSLVWLFENIQHYPQSLPMILEEKNNFAPLQTCLHKIHFPDNPEELGPYRNRLIYEELYQLALALRLSKKNFRLPGRSMDAKDLSAKLTALLPFELTGDQKTAMDILYADANKAIRMHRLLQGDVGSGKTIVALFACLPALKKGYQVAWLAPTEVLARQTFGTISPLLSKLGFSCQILTGQTQTRERRTTLVELAAGKLHVLVGTHALLEPGITFKTLGMVVIDEQHKFGAKQRLQLAQKDAAADVLVMSATPIPQTLAQTLYSDLDLVSIRSMPKGRQPVSTHLVPAYKRKDMETFILEQIQEQNSQVFYVVPRIEDDTDPESETVDDDYAMKSVKAVYATLRKGPLSPVSIGTIHGKMEAQERNQVMEEFVQGNIKILIATTIIEVGIDVPNATVLVVENADRYGLSQLHQLRGRVGRSHKKSYCFLHAELEDGSDAQKRLSYFCKHHNGFEIAEMDLSLRGPGDVTGYKQSGWEDLRIADILRDASLFARIQQDLDLVMLKTSTFV